MKEDYEFPHMIIVLFFVFLFNVVLLNFLIAIMSTTYSIMTESGSFLFKVNLYQYCERITIAFDNPEYGDLILQPPPLCLMTTPLLLCCCFLPKEYGLK
jgi:hypothetical protein